VSRIAPLLALLTLVLAIAPAEARVRVRGEELSKVRVQLCGAERKATLAAEDARVVVRSRRRLVVHRCALGRWERVTRARRRARLDTGAPADLRVRSRGSRPVFVRVGVGEIADVPVEFDVVNTNTSKVPCPTDGAPYVIRGRLVAPAAAAGAVTLYLHGVDAVGYMHLTGAPDVDLATQLARRGHASVLVDRLGYGASDRPPGDGSCLGGQADTTHQVIERLRTGEYRAQGLAPRAFERTALAGHSGGGPVAEATAYSYPGLAALIVMAWADQNFQPALFEGVLTGEGAKCASDPSAYGYVFNLEAWRKYPEAGLRPEVLALAEAGRSPNPCGDMVTLLPAPVLNTVNLGSITVPVLLVHGAQDALFGDGAGQRDHFSSSDDVTAVVYDEGGHSYFLEDALAERAQDDLSRWLAERGL
jgi:pimeloyl-ACP methyl ester carboxylesterase